MLVTSIFSFSHNVFYSITNRKDHLFYIYFVVCQCLQFGQGKSFVIWEWVKYSVTDQWGFRHLWMCLAAKWLIKSILLYIKNIITIPSELPSEDWGCSWGGAGAAFLGAGKGFGTGSVGLEVIVGSNIWGGASLSALAWGGWAGVAFLVVVRATCGGISSSSTDFPCLAFFSMSSIVWKEIVLSDWFYGQTMFSTLFQLHYSSQCSNPCFPGCFTLHNILPKPLANFPQWSVEREEWILLQLLS